MINRNPATYVKVVEEDTFKGSRRAVADVVSGTHSSKILSDIVASGVDVISYRELIPSMNDIFIKLVKSNNQK